MTEAEKDRITLNHAIGSRDHGNTRMRFPQDLDTTERLKRLNLDMESKIPLRRRLLRWLRGESW